MGIIRVTLVAPAAGAIGAVAIELFILLPVSWFASAFLVRRFRIKDLVPRLGMGVLALGLVLAGEAVTALVRLGRTPLESLNDLRNTSASLGLIGQTIFTFMPAAQWLIGQRAP